MLKFLRRKDKENISALLPLQSRFATSVKTNAYTRHFKIHQWGEQVALNSKWLVARQNKQNLWDVLLYVRASNKDGSFSTSATYEHGNRDITYAHVVCRLAAFERAEKNDRQAHRDDTIDQRTTAHHFVYSANHDGIGFDTEGNPQMSENGEFFSGEFSEEQRAAVFRFHHNPELEPLGDKSRVRQEFDDVGDDVSLTPLLDNAKALLEIEKIKKVKSFLEKIYAAIAAEYDPFDGRADIPTYSPDWRLNYKKDANDTVSLDCQPFEDCADQLKKTYKDTKSCSHLPDILRTRIVQALDQTRFILACGSYYIFTKKDNIHPLQRNNEREWNYISDSFGKAKVKKVLEDHIKSNLEEAFKEMNKGQSLEDFREFREFRENFDIAINERFFKAEALKLKSLIDAIADEIKKLTPRVQNQMDKKIITVNDPQTGKPRKFTL